MHLTIKIVRLIAAPDVPRAVPACVLVHGAYRIAQIQHRSDEAHYGGTWEQFVFGGSLLVSKPRSIHRVLPFARQKSAKLRKIGAANAAWSINHPDNYFIIKSL